MGRMANTKGLDPFPRNYGDDVPRDDIPYLEEIRRAANAVRVLRRRGRPAGAAEIRFRQACEALDKKHHHEDALRMNPTLF